MDVENVADQFFLLHEYIQKYYYQFNRNFKVNAQKSKDLSARQFYILFVIGYIKLHTISEIAFLAQQSASSMSLVASKLVKNGYLYKQRPAEAEDNRKVYFDLTEEGWKMLRKISALSVCVISDFYSGLNGELKEVFLMALEYLWRLTPGFEKTEIYIVGDTDDLSDETKLAIKILQSIILSVHWRKSQTNQTMFCSEWDKRYISIGQQKALGYIIHFDVHTLKELSKYMFLSDGALSAIISKLTHKRFLEKRFPKDGEDGRYVYFYVTQEGLEAIQAVEQRDRAAFIQYFQSFSREEQNNIKKGIKYLNMVFEQLSLKNGGVNHHEV